MSIVAEQASIVVQSPVRGRSGSPMEPYPIPLTPEPGPGPPPPAGVAVPDDFPPPHIHEADIYHAHSAGPPLEPPAERRYSPRHINHPWSLRWTAVQFAEAQQVLQAHYLGMQNRERERARAAVFDYFGGARFMGMRRVVGTELNIFHVPAAPANAGPPKKPRPQLQQPSGAYLASDDDD